MCGYEDAFGECSMKRMLVGILILGIGMGSTYVGVMQFYRHINASQITLPVFSSQLPPQYPQYVYQGEGLPPDILEEKVKAKPRGGPGETRRAQISAERRVATRKPAPTSNINKKVEPKKEIKTEEIKEEKPPTLQELTPAAAPITEKEQSPLSAKLIAYMDVEKMLSWLANIITIITGILIILRKRRDV
jgi:hypothetical protein